MIWLVVGAALAQDDVRIRGNVRHSGAGEVLVEVLLVDTGGPPLLIGSAIVAEGNGAFDVPVRARIGEVRVRAAHDINRDGIGESDPQALWPAPLVIGTEDIEGLSLHLEQPGRHAPGQPGNP